VIPISRRQVTPPLPPHAALVNRLRRTFNAVRDAQEMLERLMRTGPAALRPTLPAPIADLEWTAEAVMTALRGLEDPTVSSGFPLIHPADAPALTATRDSQPHTPSWMPLPE